MNDPKVYQFDKISVFFKHTDYHGVVHPYNYFEWMSYARESFFQELISNFEELCKRDIKMVTHKAELELNDDAVFGDQIEIDIYAENVKRLSFDVVFKFLKKSDNSLLGYGRQKLTFLDSKEGKPAKIPDDLKVVVLLYEHPGN